ncbi:putative alpha/beta hydrolase [Mycobacterium avium]|uniref:putative alpha/beta hydrolase n=1 Tax=Mycobacterium avium TaxID=1764 RepID=UPI00358DB4FB
MSVAELIAEAGGDPWAINQSLQAGSPSQISSLAEPFHGAGRHTAEADHAFEQARKRFDAAWNHQNGDHPINDSAEVQRLVNPLARSRSNFPRSAPIWKNIAAALAEAQKAGTQRVSLLEDELQGLDNVIDAAEHDLQYGHPNHVGGQATTGHTHSAPRWMRNTVSEGK